MTRHHHELRSEDARQRRKFAQHRGGRRRRDLRAGCRSAGKVFVYSPRLRLERTWAPAALVGRTRATGIRWGWGRTGAFIFADLSANRLLRYSAEGQLLGTPSRQREPRAGDPKISDEFAVSHDYIFMMDANGTMLHIWTIDGKPKLDVDLAPQLGHGTIARRRR